MQHRITPAAMPGLTIATDVQPPTTGNRRTSVSSGRESPSRPEISPITPTLESAQFPAQPASTATATTTATADNTMPDFARDRPILTHTSQTDQVGIDPPPAQPIDFDSNPDVLALKSAISILQLQRARATADIRSLSKARDAALADPQAFAADLAAGRVQVEGDPLFSGTRASGPAGEDSDDDSESDADEGEQQDGSARQEATPESESKADGSTPPADGAAAPTRGNQPKGKRRPSAAADPDAAKPQPWQRLPRPQNVVRCPPINWAKYGVVGESLDKLHAEQVAAPTPGAPMVLGPGGTYEFKAGGSAEDQSRGATTAGEQPRRLVGVAAPYNPFRDKLEKKGKGGKR
ncbi:hypothetical protein L209DRAFT_759938 [Thermothelomyces heterothallicus CBS 203.75]